MTHIIHTLPEIEARDTKRRAKKHEYGRTDTGPRKYPDDLIGHLRYLHNHGCMPVQLAQKFGIPISYMRHLLIYKMRSYIDPQRSIAYPDVDAVKAP